MEHEVKVKSVDEPTEYNLAERKRSPHLAHKLDVVTKCNVTFDRGVISFDRKFLKCFKGRRRHKKKQAMDFIIGLVNSFVERNGGIK